MNLEMFRGDSASFFFVLDLDLTDAVGVTMTAKSLMADADPGVFQKTVSDGVTVIDEPTGTIQIDLEPGDTDGLSAVRSRLFYDIQVEDVDSKVTTVRSGRLLVKPDVTTTVSGS